MRLRPLVESPADVLQFVDPSPTVLTPDSAGFRVLHFDIRDAATESVFGCVQVPDIHEEERCGECSSQTGKTGQMGEQRGNVRRVALSSDFLKCDSVRSTLTFAVGENPIGSLRIIERHYFQTRVLRSFDFTLGFCPPNSVNTRDVTYDMPQLEASTIRDLKVAPYAVATDTFFFADDRLVHHIRGEHDYHDWLCSSSAGAAMSDRMRPVLLARGLREEAKSAALMSKGEEKDGNDHHCREAQDGTQEDARRVLLPVRNNPTATSAAHTQSASCIPHPPSAAPPPTLPSNATHRRNTRTLREASPRILRVALAP